MNAAQRRPNVLFIITDQQRADHTGFGGNTTVRTPALDSIADRGVVFDEGWVSNPLCMPNRSTIMTGRMPTAHGVIFNDRSLEWGAMTHVRAFRDAGWRTALIGKSHLQHGMSRNAVLPFDRIGAVDDPWPDGWQHLEDSERYEQSMPPWPDDFYGFGHVELTIDHGARVSGHHLHWALDRGGRYEDLVVPMSDESPARRRSNRWWQIYEPPYGPELHSTTFVTERTIAFIEDAARTGQSGQPWLAWASFPDPHHPMTPPGDWFDRHDPDDIELPTTVDDPLATAPRHLQITRARTVADQFSWVTPFGVHDHQLVREAIASTYGAIEMIDDGVGQILAAVDRAGQTDDTIVVFTSDHGDMMGDHGLMTKGFIHYRGTLQVPFVIADPTRPAARTQSLASSIDLGPTLLDLCGLPGYAGIQGNSLVPILDDPATSVREHVLVEDDAPARLAKVAKFPEKSRTLITPSARYTRLSTGEDQLFDLAADPDETIELSEREPALRAQMIERLADALIAADDDARGAPLIPTG